MGNDVKSAHLRIVKPSTDAQKETRTTLDTIVVTLDIARSWKLPPFQRPLKDNAKLAIVANDIATNEVIPGVMTLGVLDKVLYVIDGQHRREAFYRSEVQEAFADIRYAHFTSMGEMADEFQKLNGRIANMTPDDMLRAEEHTNPVLRRLRRECSFIGYTQVRRGPGSPIVSMSALLRCWFGSSTEVPSLGGMNASELVQSFTDEECTTLIDFCTLAMKALGKDPEHHKLWLNLNLAICMWLYRRLVITPYSASTKKISRDMFLKCLMSVAADGSYSDWLVGRQLRERDRSPAYRKVKDLFAKRLELETGQKPRLPSPDWGGK